MPAGRIPSSAVESGPEPVNVLVVDDDDDTRSLLLDVVARHGHQVVPAGSAEDALALLPFWSFQVAVLDHNLPGIEGLVVGEYFRRNNPDMIVALVTGDTDERIERRARALDIRFVRKPFPIAAITALIDEYERRAEERQRERVERLDVHFTPTFARHAPELPDCFGVSGVSQRITERLVATIRRSLHDLRAVSRYTERDRVVALSGLITAQVLGLALPRASSGATLFEEYDEIMRARGRRAEFTEE